MARPAMAYSGSIPLAGAVQATCLRTERSSTVDIILTAHVADAIERVGGEFGEFGYDTAADMAAHMLDRFPAVREAAEGYVAWRVAESVLDSAVLDALAEF